MDLKLEKLYIDDILSSEEIPVKIDRLLASMYTNPTKETLDNLKKLCEDYYKECKENHEHIESQSTEIPFFED